MVKGMTESLNDLGRKSCSIAFISIKSFQTIFFHLKAASAHLEVSPSGSDGSMVTRDQYNKTFCHT